MIIPVGPTAQTTYAFVIAHVMTLLRLIWLPVLINALAGIFARLKLAPLVQALESKDTAAVAALFSSELGWIGICIFVPMAMNAVAAVAILRYVVRGELGTPRVPVHVAFGITELRVIAVTLLIMVVMFLISIPLSLVLGLLTSAVPSPVVMGLGSLAVILGLMIVAARWVMAYPVAAIEDRIDLKRAWALVRPSYPSFLVLIVAVVLPLLLLEFVAGVLVGPSPSAEVEVMRRDIEANWILLTGVGFVINFFLTAVFFTALGLVYRKVTGAPEWHPDESA